MFTFRPVLAVYAATRQLLFLPEHNAAARSGRERTCLTLGPSLSTPTPPRPREVTGISCKPFKHTEVSCFSLLPSFFSFKRYLDVLMQFVYAVLQVKPLINIPLGYSSFSPLSSSHSTCLSLLAEAFHSPAGCPWRRAWTGSLPHHESQRDG